MTIKLEVTPQESAFICKVIGQLPVETGAGALWQNLTSQHNEQVTEKEKPETD